MLERYAIASGMSLFVNPKQKLMKGKPHVKKNDAVNANPLCITTRLLEVGEDCPLDRLPWRKDTADLMVLRSQPHVPLEASYVLVLGAKAPAPYLAMARSCCFTAL